MQICVIFLKKLYYIDNQVDNFQILIFGEPVVIVHAFSARIISYSNHQINKSQNKQKKIVPLHLIKIKGIFYPYKTL